MEEFNREVMNMIVDLHEVKVQQKQWAAKAGKTDKYGLAYESPDMFSMEPLGFLETTMKLPTEALETFAFAREYNRHSPLFYQMAGHLEKLLSQLGSACITKAVMDQQQKSGPEMDQLLNDLTIDWLRQRTAFVFRKCYASFMESSGVLRFNQTALALSIRFSALDKRLIATAEKIEQIKSGKLKVEPRNKVSAPEHDSLPEPETSSDPEKVTAMEQKGRALPIDRNALDASNRSVDEGEPIEDVQSSNAPVDEESNFGDALDNAAELATEVQSVNTPVVEENNFDVPLDNKAEPGAETPSSNTLMKEEDDFCETFEDEEENLPVVSADLVRMMSEHWNDPDFLAWVMPAYEYADSG